ncbi:MAG: hypothetical protein HY699_16780 [Deltaproteobacteria bacterium]|nr:hypothetical protein [Deltaproteobacteria bacterium]
MASRDEGIADGRSVARWLLVAAVCLVSICASACPASAPAGSASDVPSEISELLGKDVMISFKWSTPTSVLESLTLVGRLVRVDEEVLVVDVKKSIRSEQQEQVVGALERHGKLKRDPDGHLVYALRREIADLRLYPRI